MAPKRGRPTYMSEMENPTPVDAAETRLMDTHTTPINSSRVGLRLQHIAPQQLAREKDRRLKARNQTRSPPILDQPPRANSSQGTPTVPVNHVETEVSDRVPQPSRVEEIVHPEVQQQPSQTLDEADHSTPEQIQTETDASSGRSGRGVSITYELKDKLKVKTNNLNQFIGEDESKLTSLIGCIVRTPSRAPLNVVSWKQMPEAYLDSIWDELQEKTDVDESLRNVCMDKARQLWGKWKNRAKELYFTPFQDDPEKLRIPPSTEQIANDQWPDLVTYWQREEIKEQAKRNSSNRQKLQVFHRKGRTSFAKVREKREKQNLPNDRVSVLIDVMTKSDGSVPDEKTKELVSKVTEELEKVPEEERTPDYREKVFVSVFGKDRHGRVRTMGAGVRPRAYFGTSSGTTVTSAKYQAMEDRVQVLEKRDKDLNEQLAKKDKEMDGMKQMMAFLRSHLEATGVQVPNFDIGTPRSSVGQVPTSSSEDLCSEGARR